MTKDWVTKSFAIHVVSNSLLSTFLKEDTIELSFGRLLKISLVINLCDFPISLNDSFPIKLF